MARKNILFFIYFGAQNAPHVSVRITEVTKTYLFFYVVIKFYFTYI